MNDILGRELKVGDLVIGMVIARGSDGMRHGIFNGSSVHWIKYGGRYITTSTMSNIYLVENPCAKELEIKDKIISVLEENRIEAEKKEVAKKLMKRIPTKDLISGKVYVTDTGTPYIYIGKGKVVNHYTKEEKEGFIYMYPRGSYNSDSDSFSYMPDLDVLKNPRKLVKESEIVPCYDFSGKKEFKIQEKGYRGVNGFYGCSRADKIITITLN